MQLFKDTTRVRALIACISVLLISGCGDSQLPKKTVAAEHYINQVVSYKKPGAAISLANTEVMLEGTGVEYDVDIDIISEYSSGELTLTLSSSKGLYLFGDKSQTIPLIRGNINLPFTVIANEPGRYYVYINAHVNQDGLSSGRALTFIINIGKSAVNGTSLKAEAATNNGIIELKAKEEIIRQ
jgi:hypothetical protein